MAGVAVRSRGLSADRGAEVVAGQLPSSVVTTVSPVFANGATQTDLNNIYGSGTHPPLSAPVQVQVNAPAGNFNEAAAFFGLNVPAASQVTSQEVALYAMAQDLRTSTTDPGGLWGFNAVATVQNTGTKGRSAEFDINNYGTDSGSTFAGGNAIFGISIDSGGTKRPMVAVQVEVAGASAPFYYGMRFQQSVYSLGSTIQSLSNSATQVEYEARVGVEANPRFQFTTSGVLTWGAGGASATDCNLYRIAGGIIGSDTAIRANQAGVPAALGVGHAGSAQGGVCFGAGSDTSIERLAAASLGTLDSDFSVALAGKGLRVKEGTNAKQGVSAAMVAGTTTVANTSVTATSRIILTRQDGGTNPGAPYVSARAAGTSFTITSTNAADTGTVAYQIFEPA